MPTPGGPISLNDLYQEGNPGWSTLESFSDITYDSWAQGPLGSSTNTYNGWGNDGSGGGTPVGGNVIYNVGGALIKDVDAINFGNYTNKYYYFDGTVFDIKYAYNNTLNNILFPPPPVINDVNIQVDCYDYSGTYLVHNSFNITANGGTSQGAITIPGFVANASPLVENVYWSIIINTDPSNTISNIAFKVNSSTVYNAGGGGGSFTWTSGGASQGYTNSSGILYDVVIT
jgi:hypothetical protein